MTFQEMERALDRQQQQGREIDERIAALLKSSENHESRLAGIDKRIAALLESSRR